MPTILTSPDITIPPHIKGLVFDCDGTIAHTMPLHYQAWLARRWDDPAFPAAFPWFNTQRYWQDRILELREQVALMDEPPLDV